MSSSHFVNPYNFIPLQGKKKDVTKYDAREKCFSGVIVYSLLTKTPLFIPNTSNKYAFENTDQLSEEERKKDRHKSYDFFSYHNLSETMHSSEKEYYEPVIPGSEIRGMLRSNYEILTNSCLSAMETDMVMSKRTSQRYMTGLLKKTERGYELYEARSYTTTDRFTKYKKYSEGEKVFFKGRRETVVKFGKTITVYYADDIGSEFDETKIEGYIIIGESGVRKAHAHIFELINDREALYKNVSIDSLEKVLDAYEKNKEYHRAYREEFKKFKRGELEYFPVYYSVIDRNNILLSCAQITREIYKNDLQKAVRHHKTCSKKEELCPACSLFGYVRGSLNQSTRIRFGDLVCTGIDGQIRENREYYLPCKTLQELSAPKLNNMEFYLKRPGKATFWTYDYYIENGRIIPYVAQINGRKFYWHNMIEDQDIPTSNKKGERNSTIRPLRSGVQFEGRLYFDKVSEEELKKLIWLLSFGKDDATELKDKQYGYKLGGAKPLGLGSIAMQVDRVMVKRTEINDGMIERVEEPYTVSVDQSLFEQDIVKNYLTMTKFDTVKDQNVAYPYPEGTTVGQVEGFKWYTGNHMKLSRGRLESRMPNRREEMAFAEYMEAMEPVLKDTINRPTEHSVSQNSERKEVGGQAMEVIVNGINQKGNAFLKSDQLDRNKRHQLNKNKMKSELQKGDIISVRLLKESKFDNGDIVCFYEQV